MPGNLYLVTSGNFSSGPSQVKVIRGSLVKRYSRTENVTGASDSINGSFYETGRPNWFVNVQGIYEASRGVWPLASFHSDLTGDFTFRTSRLQITKTQEIRNITGASDPYADSVFAAGRATYQYSGFGWASDTDTIAGDKTATGNEVGTFSATIYDTATDVSLTGAIKILTYSVGLPFSTGGPVPIRWKGVGNTDTPIATNTPWAQTSYTATLDVAGKKYSGTVIPSLISCDIDYENGVPTVVSVQGPYSGGVTIT